MTEDNPTFLDILKHDPLSESSWCIFLYTFVLLLCIPLIFSGLKDFFLDLHGSLLLFLIMGNWLADVVVKYLKNLHFLLLFYLLQISRVFHVLCNSCLIKVRKFDDSFLSCYSSKALFVRKFKIQKFLKAKLILNLTDVHASQKKVSRFKNFDKSAKKHVFEKRKIYSIHFILGTSDDFQGFLMKFQGQGYFFQISKGS